MAEKRTKSNKKFMLLSAIGIFMVVDSHTWGGLNFFGDYIPYNSFFMPMFVFISGYFNRIDASTKLWPYTLKKLKTLLLPYAGLSLLVFCLQWLINLIKLGESVPPPPGYLMYILENAVTTGAPIMIATPMWFVITLFATLMIYAVIKKFLSKIYWNSFIMLAVFTILHLFAVYTGINANREALIPLLLPFKVMFFLPFLELGIIYREYLEKKHTSLSGGFKIGLMFLMLVINMFRTLYLPNIYDLAFDSISDLSGFTSPYIVTPMISSVVGITFWLTLADLAGKPVYESRFINYMSCNTFWIMGLQIVFFNVLNCILLIIHNNLFELKYFDVEYFQESEWYRWELSPDFKLAYIAFGILGPLGLKLLYDKIVSLIRKALIKVKNTEPAVTQDTSI